MNMVEDLEPDKSTNNWFRSPPVQRQKWGDKQAVPHANWGDMFFDLFYVAAAYNLSQIIKDSKDLIGLMYFIGCFFPVTNIWMNKMVYDGRFQLPDDIFHVGLEIFRLCILATAVLHIRPVKYMSTGASNIEMLLFCTGVWLNAFYDIMLHLEIRCWGVIGQKCAKYAAMTSVYMVLPSFILISAATLYSLFIYVNGESYAAESVHHAPIILMGSSSFVRMFVFYPIIYYRGKGANFKELSVPINVNYVIHRNGEWTMLMLGESILSLLIVAVEDEVYEFYLTFYLGVVSVTFLQYLYFKSQPSEADEHAMRRSRLAATIFASLIQFYSAALIIVGVSFKMLLSEYKHEGAYEEYVKATSSIIISNRFLGAEDDSASKYSMEERRQLIANFFCIGLAAVFLFLDLMTISHNGVEKLISNCRCPTDRHLRVKGILFVVVFRIAVVLFIGTASIYSTDPEIVATFGFISILLQIIIRFLGTLFFPSSHSKNSSHDEDHGQKITAEDNFNNEHWPNISEPAAMNHNPA